MSRRRRARSPSALEASQDGEGPNTPFSPAAFPKSAHERRSAALLRTRPSVPPHRACAPQRPSGYNEHASAEALGTADQAPAFKHGLDDR